MAHLGCAFVTMMCWHELLPGVVTTVEVAPIRLGDPGPYDVKADWACEFYVHGIEKHIPDFLADEDACPDPLVPQKVQMINMVGGDLYSFIMNHKFSDFVYKVVFKVTACAPIMTGNYDWSFSTVDDFIEFDGVLPGLRLGYGIVDFEDMSRA